jgi:hypothetical protein
VHRRHRRRPPPCDPPVRHDCHRPSARGGKRKLQVAPQRAREPAARWCWSSWTSGCRALPTRGRWSVHRHHEHQCGRPSFRRAALPRGHRHRAEPARCPNLPEHRPQRAHGCVRAPSLTRQRTAHGTRPVPRRQSNPSTRAWCAAASPGATPPTPPRNPYLRVCRLVPLGKVPQTIAENTISRRSRVEPQQEQAGIVKGHRFLSRDQAVADEQKHSLWRAFVWCGGRL